MSTCKPSTNPPSCQHYSQACKLCTHDKEFVIPNEKFVDDVDVRTHLRPGDFVTVHHTTYKDGECEWTDVCSLKFIKEQDSGKELTLENANGKQFIIRSKFISSYCFCSPSRKPQEDIWFNLDYVRSVLQMQGV